MIKVKVLQVLSYRVRSVVSQFRTKFILELSSPYTFSTCSRPQRVSSLDHELFDDTVEDMTVIISVTSVNTEILHLERTEISERNKDIKKKIMTRNCG